MSCKRREKLDRSSIDQHFLLFLRKYKETDFSCGHNIFTQGVLVTQMYGIAGAPVLRIVCVNKNSLYLGEVIDIEERLNVMFSVNMYAV
jgi:hypothetical protein